LGRSWPSIDRHGPPGRQTDFGVAGYAVLAAVIRAGSIADAKAHRGEAAVRYSPP